IVLGGFSQGACLTLEVAARHPRRYGAILGLSGGLIGPPGTPRNYTGSFAGTPVFLGCSDPDPHIPFARVQETRDVLKSLAADAPRNLRFYTQALGLRLVKKTVNQDDVSAYHLFYADGRGTPGTDVTFFDWPTTRERRGTHSITRTGLRVASVDSLRYWEARLKELSITHTPIADRDGRPTLDLEDFEGQRLSLVADHDG